MNAYHIYNSRSGHYLGSYRATDEAEALEALARDCGYSSHEEACRFSNGWLSDIVINEASDETE